MPPAKQPDESMPPDEKPNTDQLDKKLLELSALFDVCRSLTSSLSLRSILENVLRIPMGQLLIGKGIILLKQVSSSDFVVEELKGLPRQLVHKSLSILSPPEHVLRIDPAADNEGWISFFREFGIELVLPLTSSKGTVGIAGFGAKINGKRYEENEIEFLDSLSSKFSLSTGSWTARYSNSTPSLISAVSSTPPWTGPK